MQIGLDLNMYFIDLFFMTTKIKSIEEIIESSWHNFSEKVDVFFRKSKPSRIVDSGSYYVDFSDNKNREMDLVATFYRDVPKSWWQWHDNFDHYRIAVRLFIECKYLNKNIVFRDANIDQEEIIQNWIANNTIYRSLRGYQEGLGLKNHYSFDKKFFSKHDQAENNDLIYKSLTQSLHSLIYYKNNKKFVDQAQYILDYPVVLTQSFDTFFDDKWKNIDNNFVYYMKNYNHSQWTNSFLVDFVSFDSLNSYLEEIENELDEIWEKFWKKSSFESRQ